VGQAILAAAGIQPALIEFNAPPERRLQAGLPNVT